MSHQFRLLGISGSLRAHSFSTAVLDALVEALVQRAPGSVITAADLAAMDFRPDSLTVGSGFARDPRGAPEVGVSGELGTPLPLPTRRRPGPRRRR